MRAKGFPKRIGLGAMLEGSKLTASHNLQLHIPHAVLVILTGLFLLLGGISGPSTGIWWLSLRFTSDNSGGTTWNAGGRGVCVADQR